MNKSAPHGASPSAEDNIGPDIQAREDVILGKPPRILPLPRDQVAEAASAMTARLRRAALGDVPPLSLAEIPEIVITLLRHPDLWERVAALSIQLLGHGVLTPRERELAILRVSWLCQAPYEWGEHVKQAKIAGITSEEIERVIYGASAPGWDEHEHAILLAVEELHRDSMISDVTWEILAKRLDERQLFELPVLIGQFTAVAYFQNALRLALPEGNLGLRAR